MRWLRLRMRLRWRLSPLTRRILTVNVLTLVLLGIFGLSKALAGQPYVYPLIGKSCDLESSI